MYTSFMFFSCLCSNTLKSPRNYHKIKTRDIKFYNDDDDDKSVKT